MTIPPMANHAGEVAELVAQLRDAAGRGVPPYLGLYPIVTSLMYSSTTSYQIS